MRLPLKNLFSFKLLLNLTCNKKILVKHLEVVEGRPTLTHTTISVAEELSRHYSHIRCVYCCRTHHIRTIATNYESTFLNVRSYEYLEAIDCTSEVRTIYLTSRSCLPTLNERENRKNVRSSKNEVRSKLLCCIVNSLLSNLKNLNEALVVLGLRLIMLQIIHLITSYQTSSHLLKVIIKLFSIHLCIVQTISSSCTLLPYTGAYHFELI